jgi:HK97 family phage major capsid protein
MNTILLKFRTHRLAAALMATLAVCGAYLIHAAHVAAAHTLVVAHNLLQLGGLATVPLMLGVVEDEERTGYEKRVLDGLDDIRTNVKKQKEELLTDIKRLDGVTQKALEDLTKIKNETNASVDSFTKQLAQVNRLLSQERRAAFGDPIQRIVADDDMRTRINLAVRRACNKDGSLASVIRTMHDQAKVRGLTLDDSPGSTYLDDTLNKQIYSLLAQHGAWNTLGVEPLSTRTTKFLVDTADPIAYVILPGGTRALADDANMAGTSTPIDAQLIGVLITVFNELLMDSEIDVAGRILRKFQNAVNYRMDFCAFAADGTEDATNGEFTGLFEYAPVVTADAGHDSVAELEFTDFLKCLVGVQATVLTRAARWWLHPTMLARSLAIRDENGRPIWQTALENPNIKSVTGMLGYPATLVHAAPNTDGASKPVAAFGDPDGFAVGVRQSFEFAVSDDFKFSEYKRAYRGIARAAFLGRSTGAFRTLETAAS